MPLRRPRYHHGALDSALLEEAVRQVRARGAEHVSLRGLAQSLGVSPSAAYQHFPDKAALLTAVGTWAFDELTRRMRAAMNAETSDDDQGAVARFAAIGRAYVQFAASEPHLFRHMFSALLLESVGEKTENPADHAVDVPLHEDDGAHELLLHALADLAARGLLREDLHGVEGLDVLAWSLVHGFSALVLDQHLPLEAGPPLILLFGRLVLRVGVVDDFALRVAWLGPPVDDGTQVTGEPAGAVLE